MAEVRDAAQPAVIKLLRVEVQPEWIDRAQSVCKGC